MEFVWAVVALAIYALFDYFGYNAAEVHNSVPEYRKVQVVFAAVLIALLWTWMNYQSVLMGVFMWWTFSADFMYYQWAKWIKKYPDEIRGFENDVEGNKVIWAWWTPVGLAMGRAKNKTKPIDGLILTVQMLVGVICAIIYQIIIYW